MASTDRVSRTPLTTLLLQKYYANVQDLKSYLPNIVHEPNLDRDLDDEWFRAFLRKTIVATNSPHENRKCFQVHSVSFGMDEVVTQAQRRILASSSTSNNIVTFGCQLGASVGGVPSVVKKFKNTVITAFRMNEWNVLLSRIGVDAMFYLLTEASIFAPLPNDCLCQITGQPIFNLYPLTVAPSRNDNSPVPDVINNKRKLDGSAHFDDVRPYKRRRLAQVQKKTILPSRDPTLAKPAGILFARARLFYARPCIVPRANHLVVGLPVSHILNRLHASYVRDKDTRVPHKDPDPRKQAEDVRHLSKYVFPSQYGLDTPFQTSAKKDAFPYPDYLDRESEITRLGPCKTPKRLKETLTLLDQMLHRHTNCTYMALRDRTCPSKIPIEDGKRIDSTVILELISEQSIQLDTQPSLHLNEISVDSSGNPRLPYSGTQAKVHAHNKPRFVEFVCSHTEVFRYVALVTKAVIPMQFWGNKSNFHLVLKAVKRFITCRRYETLSLHYVLQGFSTTACDWLVPPGGAQTQNRVCVSDSLKRRELLEEFLFWYFDGFVTPLLRTTFYITESSAFRNQILYFRQDDWKELCAPLLERLIGGMFERVPEKDVKEILHQRALGFSFVRLLPKETGVRPIVNLRKRIATGRFTGGKSINQVLQTAFNVLTYERNVRMERLGASVFGSDEVYTKLKAFKAGLPKGEDGKLPHLYFVKVDVQACFDSIDQTKLLEILQDLISSDAYVTQRYGQVHFSSSQIKRTFVQRALPQGHGKHFIKTAKDLASVLRNVIFADKGNYPTETSKEEILKLLEEHITENIVKIGNHFYRQKVGIPQGSVLSALLCSFFYGDLERRKMKTKFTQDLESVLLRLIDDYLFITTSLEKAKEFLAMMMKGHPEYGCFISKEKTLINFDHGSDLMNKVDPSSKNFPWCGYLINMHDLSVSVDYSRYGSWGMKNTLTVERGRRSGATFKHKMLLFGQARNHVIFSDPQLNSDDTVYLNIYQNFVLAALKMQEYIREGGLKLANNSVFVYKTIQQTIESSYTSIMAQAMRKSKADDAPKIAWHVKKLAVFWLGSHAFYHILRRKPHGYASVLRHLEKQLGRLCNRYYKRRFKRLVREGQAAFEI